MNLGLTPEQLAERRNYLGATDASCIAGMGLRSPWEIYLEKTGQLPSVEMNDAMEWGLRLESVVAKKYADDHGEIEMSKPATMYHAKHPWMAANLDYVSGAGRIVEVKTASHYSAKQGGEPGTDEVPSNYLIQVQHQMAVADLDTADIAVLIGASDYREYTVRRSDELIADLIYGILEPFWERVQRRDPPGVDFGSGRNRQLLAKLNKPTGPEIQVFEDDPLAQAVCYLESMRAKKLIEEKIEIFKAQLIARMGDAAVMKLQDGIMVSRKLIKRKSYTVKETEYATFKVEEGE